MAENGDRIKRIIDNDSYSKAGIFRFYFWVKGKWWPINIDDRLPARKYNGYVNGKWTVGAYKPHFNQPSSYGSWWMPLLEKAYAKYD